MEVKIGVQNAARELTVDTDLDAEAITKQVEDAVASGGVLSFADNKGRQVVVPADKLAYVEVGVSHAGTVGFRGGS